MTQRGMPFLMINLGAEMIFVLHSRLRAQAVPPKKSEEVMRDIGGNLFSAAFLNELFTPQPLYTPSSVMQVFATLSNSSVMHLSDNSMRRLYDLAFMTVKYQLFTLRHPLEVYELTMNHLDSVQELLPASVQPLLADATTRFARLVSGFTIAEWAAVRRTLLNFFGGRHVRVSVFLDNGVQNSTTGAFYMPADTYLSPCRACHAPGRIETADGQLTATFEHPDAGLPYPPSIPLGSWDPTNPKTRMTSNGFDMYAASKTPLQGRTGGAGFADPLGKQTRELPAPRRTGAESGPAVPITAHALTQAEAQRAYDAEVNYLSRIVGGGANRASSVQTFELELFDDPAGHSGRTGTAAEALSSPSSSASPTLQSTTTGTPAAAAAAAPAAPSAAVSTSASTAQPQGRDATPAAVPVSRMTASTVQEQNKKLLGILHDFDGAEGGAAREQAAAKGKGSGASDLLDIMDEI